MPLSASRGEPGKRAHVQLSFAPAPSPDLSPAVNSSSTRTSTSTLKPPPVNVQPPIPSPTDWLIHNLTHEPAWPHCDVCKATKQKATASSRGGPVDCVEVFGRLSFDTVGPLDPGTAPGGKGELFLPCTAMLNAVDEYTGWMFTAPLCDKTAEGCAKAAKHIEASCDKTGTPITHVHSDNGTEFAGQFGEWARRAGESKPRLHTTSLPYRPQTNGLVERANGRILAGTRASLLCAGASHQLWPLASEHWTFNAIRTTGAYSARFGRRSTRKLVPWGSGGRRLYTKYEIQKLGIGKLDAKSVPCVILGYAELVRTLWLISGRSRKAT